MSEDLLLLKNVCTEMFGLSERIALRKASLGLLPVPAFRLSGTRKGPMYVRQCDLDSFVQRQVDQYNKLNSKMRIAGLV